MKIMHFYDFTILRFSVVLFYFSVKYPDVRFGQFSHHFQHSGDTFLFCKLHRNTGCPVGYSSIASVLQLCKPTIYTICRMPRLTFRCKSTMGYQKCLKFCHIIDNNNSKLYSKFDVNLFSRNNKTDNIK